MAHSDTASHIDWQPSSHLELSDPEPWTPTLSPVAKLRSPNSSAAESLVLKLKPVHSYVIAEAEIHSINND